ncbi:MAG TPA: HAMP domain-containing sensor histidine kinase [Planctomycetaceae bacterium]|nr:HAMP domain-containing sensor histidine kinase [Planctomycetaceae bacterium]
MEVGVLFTRTLRRKLLLGVGLVLGMLLVLSISGTVGLNSYRKLILDLDDDINAAPQPAELMKSIASLYGPLYLYVRDGDTRARAQQQALFHERLIKVRVAVDEYRRRLDRLPPASARAGQRPVTESLLYSIDNNGLSELEHGPLPLKDEQAGQESVTRMKETVNRMLMAAHEMPDPADGLRKTLLQAKSAYESTLTAVLVTTAIALLLFLGLLRYGHIWIFHPLRQLHQGALRVAHGDFDYRLTLRTRDEMAELAAAFNQMTARFQEVAADLDAQVQERSKQLVRSERLAGVGFLAAGVAHEINNPLSAIAMAAESLEGRVASLLCQLPGDEADVVRRYLEMIQSESFRCKQITERLLDFSRAREATREMIDLTRLVSEVVAMVQYLTRYREKKIDFSGSEPCYAEVSGSEIKQVVLNLIANGLDAVDRGGTLRIAIVEQTDHVRIEFHDDGCGMTAEVLENMFEPFFTRKQNGQGTGLGLSISHRIVSQHGGTISATSPGPGLGSTFVVRLPRRMPQVGAAA